MDVIILVFSLFYAYLSRIFFSTFKMNSFNIILEAEITPHHPHIHMNGLFMFLVEKVVNRDLQPNCSLPKIYRYQKNNNLRVSCFERKK